MGTAGWAQIVERIATVSPSVGCIAGALTRSEYLAGLAAAGFVDSTVSFTHEVAPGMHAAIVQATKPSPQDDAGD